MMLTTLGRGLAPLPADAAPLAVYLVDENGNSLLAESGQFLCAE